jgi:chromosome segregation ATPase
MSKVSELRAKYDTEGSRNSRSQSVFVKSQTSTSPPKQEQTMSPISISRVQPTTQIPQQVQTARPTTRSTIQSSEDELATRVTLQDRIRNFIYNANSPPTQRVDLSSSVRYSSPADEEAHGLTISTMQSHHRQDVNKLRSTVEEKDKEIQTLTKTLEERSEQLKEVTKKLDQQQKQYTDQILSLEQRLHVLEVELERERRESAIIREKTDKEVDKALEQRNQLQKLVDKLSEEVDACSQKYALEIERYEHAYHELQEKMDKKPIDMDVDDQARQRDVVYMADRLRTLLESFGEESKLLMDALEDIVDDKIK